MKPIKPIHPNPVVETLIVQANPKPGDTVTIGKTLAMALGIGVSETVLTFTIGPAKAKNQIRIHRDVRRTVAAFNAALSLMDTPLKAVYRPKCRKTKRP